MQSSGENEWTDYKSLDDATPATITIVMQYSRLILLLLTIWIGVKPTQ